MRVALLASLFVLATSATEARPPPDADMSLAPWFQSLRQPGTGASCCSLADCRQADYRVQDGHYEAFVDGSWRKVPPETVLQRSDNPTGRAVVCYTPYRGVMCFIKGPET